jgi:hypothetical protein
LVAIQVKVKQAVVEVEEKLIDFTPQAIEKITEIEVAVVKEVEVAKAASQHFISAWKKRKQA